MEDSYKIAVDRLRGAGIDNAENEARWLHEGADNTLYEERILRRLGGEPLQYILGNAPFYNVELQVGPGVLIPRPETEQLVEIALKMCAPHSAVLDLCTGSGAIPLAMAQERKDCTFTGIDISPDALRWARKNLEATKLSNVRFLEGDLFAPLEQDARFAMITANPPYVTPDEYAHLESTVRDFEPRLALEAQDNGLAIIRRIAQDAASHLLPGGTVIMEIGETQGTAVQQIFTQASFSATIAKDYANKPRFLIAKL